MVSTRILFTQYDAFSSQDLDRLFPNIPQARKTRLAREPIDMHIQAAVAYSLLRKLIGPCPISYTQSGACRISNRPDIYISISHTNGAAAAAVSPLPIGVDIEVIRPVSFQTICRICDRETAQQITQTGNYSPFFAVWCKKEAHYKATGLPFSSCFDSNAFFSTQQMPNHFLAVCTFGQQQPQIVQIQKEELFECKPTNRF